MKRFISHCPVLALILVAMILFTGCNREPAAWRGAKTANTISSYETYLEHYPSGKHAGEAQVQLKALYAKIAAAAWPEVEKTNPIDAYKAFLAKYPEADKRLRQMASHKLAMKLELDEWRKALNERSTKAFEYFLAEHPHSNRKDQTRMWLNLANIGVDMQSIVTLYGKTDSVIEKGSGAFDFATRSNLRMGDQIFPAGLHWTLTGTPAQFDSRFPDKHWYQKPKRIVAGKHVLVYMGKFLSDESAPGNVSLPVSLQILAVLQVDSTQGLEGIDNLK